MLVKKLDLNYISRTLLKIFKRLHRSDFPSKSFYIFLLFVLFLNFKKGFFLQQKNRVILRNRKYYHYTYGVFFSKIYYNYLEFKNIENHLDLEKFRGSLSHKNHFLSIYLENFTSQNNSLKKIEYDFFFKPRKSLIYFEEDYKFRIDVFSFLFYGKFIEYIRKSIYNEYLTFIPVLFSYPLLKTFFRLIIYSRRSKIQDNNFRFSSNMAILRKYHLYDDWDHLKIFKEDKRSPHYLGSSFLIENLLNSNIMKLLFVWKNKKFYHYLDQLFYKFFKSTVILPAYSINLNYEEEEDITDTNKLNMMGLYSLYWQMNRYGFRFNYYYYLHSLFSFLKSDNLNSIFSYNIFYLKFILGNVSFNYWIFWYKLMKVILLDFIYSTFFKFFKSNKLNLKKKKLRFKRLLSFRFLMETYNFLFLPLDMDLYYNNLNLLKNLEIGKIYLDHLLIDIFLGHLDHLSSDLNFNLGLIQKKINLDGILFNNIDYYLNLFFFYINKNIGKYFFINFLSQYRGLNNFMERILVSWFDRSSNFYFTRDHLISKSSRYIDFNISKHIGINYFYSYRNRYLKEYLWDFEFNMIYSFYLIILFKYNQLYLKIFIGKFLLFGNK